MPNESQPRTPHGLTTGDARDSSVASRVPPQSDPPQRHEQDTQAVEGEDVLNPPQEAELVQRSRVQG